MNCRRQDRRRRPEAAFLNLAGSSPHTSHIRIQTGFATSCSTARGPSVRTRAQRSGELPRRSREAPPRHRCPTGARATIPAPPLFLSSAHRPAPTSTRSPAATVVTRCQAAPVAAAPMCAGCAEHPSSRCHRAPGSRRRRCTFRSTALERLDLLAHGPTTRSGTSRPTLVSWRSLLKHRDHAQHAVDPGRRLEHVVHAPRRRPGWRVTRRSVAAPGPPSPKRGAVA